MHKLKILGEGQLEYYKPMKGTTKKKGDQIFKFQVIFGGKQKSRTRFLTQIWWVEKSLRKLWFIFGRIYTKNIYIKYI